MDEIWKVITYAPNYEVSDFGNIRNINTQKVLLINYERLKKDNKRARPGLSHNGALKQYYLHRIVAEHFIDNPDNLPEVNHIDGDFYNNRADNLEWISKLNNMRHASENKLMKRYTRKVIITNKETGEEKIFEKVTDCSEYLKCSAGLISRTCSGKRVDKVYEMRYECEDNQIVEDEDTIWKEYPECNKYLVSNTGEVKNKKTNRVMMGSKVNGYRFMTLFIDKDTPKMNRLVHRMVAQTFLENPEDKPVVNHKDTNILNNCVENLEWVTYKENMNTEETISNLKKGKNSKTIHQVLIETGEIVNTFNGAPKENEDICKTSVLKICHYYNGNETYGGGNSQRTYKKKYIFIFDEDKDKLDECLKIAKEKDNRSNRSTPHPNKKGIIQINKETGETVNEFQSGYEASKKLDIYAYIINNICNYYKYTDEDRPKRLKYFHSHKGFIYKQV